MKRSKSHPSNNLQKVIKICRFLHMLDNVKSNRYTYEAKEKKGLLYADFAVYDVYLLLHI